MASQKPENQAWVNDRNRYALSLYAKATSHAEDLEDLFTGDFQVNPDIQDADLEIVRSSQARTILFKKLSMLAVRSHKQFTVAEKSGGTRERDRVERLERACQAYLENQIKLRQADPLRDSAFFALLRGRAGVHTVYTPMTNSEFPIEMRIYDPLTYFPVYSGRRLEWFTRDYYADRQIMKDWFAPFDWGKMDVEKPDFSHWNTGITTYNKAVRVIEYWDDTWSCYVVDGVMIGPFEHGYGRMTLQDIRLNQTPLSEQRFAYDGTYGGVEDELKASAILLSKQATGVQQFYYPKIVVQDENNNLVVYDAAQPGDPVQIHPDSRIQILNPIPASDVLQLLQNRLDLAIQKATISDQAYSLQSPDVSGFLHQQVQAQIMDAIADEQYPLQRGWGAAFGDFLYLAEKFGPAQKGGGWSLAFDRDGRRTVEILSPADIDGHYDVTLTIKLQHPSDKLQIATLFNQLRGLGADGRPNLPYRAALQVSGLADLMADVPRMENERDLELLLQQDPETQAIYLEYIKARNVDALRDMKQVADKAERKEEGRQEREEIKAVARGDSAALIIPGEIKSNPDVLRELAELIEQGIDPKVALQMVLEQKPSAGGQPGAQQGLALSDEEMQFLLNFDRPGQPTGMTGYDGIDTRALPPAGQGALPRRVVDQDNLYIEGVEEDQRRGALPPPK